MYSFKLITYIILGVKKKIIPNDKKVCCISDHKGDYLFLIKQLSQVDDWPIRL